MLFLTSIAFFQLGLGPQMLLKCCLLHRGIALPRQAIFLHSCLYAYIYFSIITFTFITIKDIIWLTRTNLFFGHVCQKFNLRMLLSFCLFFANFSLVLLISVAYRKKRVYKKTFNELNLDFGNKHLSITQIKLPSALVFAFCLLSFSVLTSVCSFKTMISWLCIFGCQSTELSALTMWPILNHIYLNYFCLFSNFMLMKGFRYLRLSLLN